jgi:hypothetical protein
MTFLAPAEPADWRRVTVGKVMAFNVRNWRQRERGRLAEGGRRCKPRTLIAAILSPARYASPGRRASTANGDSRPDVASSGNATPGLCG